jgi:hypothetical protein
VVADLVAAEHVAPWAKDALASLGWTILRPPGSDRRSMYREYHLRGQADRTVGPFESPHAAVEWAKGESTARRADGAAHSGL